MKKIKNCLFVDGIATAAAEAQEKREMGDGQEKEEEWNKIYIHLTNIHIFFWAGIRSTHENEIE